MQQYLVVTGGWLIGMLILIIVKSIYVQQSKKYDYTFKQAFLVYINKDIGPIFLSIVMLFAGVFLLPEIVASAALMSDGKIPADTLKTKAVNAIVHNMRFYSIIFGILSQGIGFMAVSKSYRWLKKVSDITDGRIDNMKDDEPKTGG